MHTCKLHASSRRRSVLPHSATQLLKLALLTLATASSNGCSGPATGPADNKPAPAQSPSILLVTLDTSRADAFGFQGGPVSTPSMDQLAQESVRFSHAFAPAPMTLPSHVSMFTGLYPSDHGVHENARNLDPGHPLLAKLLKAKGYQTAAFVSAVPLLHTFGLDAGFDHYDDNFGNAPERRGSETTTAALAFLSSMRPGLSSIPAGNTSEGNSSSGNSPAVSPQPPLFIWVHYYDPHAPYLDTHLNDTKGTIGSLGSEIGQRYLSEILAVDQQVGRMVDGFRSATGPNRKFIVVGDHGESLGEFGERTHGSLLHANVLRVPLLVTADQSSIDSPPELGKSIDHPVSIRRVFGTVLDWASANTAERSPSLFDPPEAVVLAEALQPYLQYGWQPQVAGVDAFHPETLAWLEGSEESGASLTLLDVEQNRPTTDRQASAALRAALRTYSTKKSHTPSGTPADLSATTRAQLASLGYVSGNSAPERRDAPKASAMTHLFDPLDRASAAFESNNYRAALAPLREVLAADPGNFSAALRLAVAHSTLATGRAGRYFDIARALAPESKDLRHFEGMHLLRQGQLNAAGALFESVLAAEPQRLTSLTALYQARTRQGDLPAAIEALTALTSTAPNVERFLHLGKMHMTLGHTQRAITALEDASALDPTTFDTRFSVQLDLGVLYLAARRFADARGALDLALQNQDLSKDRSALAMALFKRAQVSALLNEPDLAQRIQDATEKSDATTRALIVTERLFQGIEL